MKADFQDLGRFNMPPDNPSDDEYRALVQMDTCNEAQEIMNKRIIRITECFKDRWNDHTREKRSMYKKKMYCIPPQYDLLQTRTYVLFRST